MDTKSKKFSSNIFLRAVLFIVCGMSIATACLAFTTAISERNIISLVEYFVHNNEVAGSFDSGMLISKLWYSYMPVLGISGLIAVLSLMWLVFTTGGRVYKVNTEGSESGSDLDKSNQRKIYAADKIWTEVQLTAVILAVTFGCFLLLDVWYEYFVRFPLNTVLKDCVNTVWRNDGGIISVEEFDNLEILERLGSIKFEPLKAFGEVYKGFTIDVPLAALGFVLCTFITLWFGLSLIRLIKSRSFFKNSVVWRAVVYVGRIIGNFIMNIVNGGSLMKKALLIMLGTVILSATIVGAPIMILLIAVFVPKWVKRFEAIQKGIDEVKSGNLAYKIPIRSESEAKQRKRMLCKDDELTKLARGINEISHSSNEAVKNELKNQRMKTELISNVSHDLKTPLTSLVTYIDLLKTEGLDSPNAPEYLEVLDSKTERLRKLTEDLFEAAKASSGAMPVNIENVDALSLINQVMGETNDRIEASGLEFIVKHGTKRSQGIEEGAIPTKYMVLADGQLLYRVVDNLINNILKYALPGSRVYIDISEPIANYSRTSQAAQPHTSDSAQSSGTTETHEKAMASNGLVLIEFKNISAQALNIDPDELMERFKRGDESRTTEGSGLGLAIAKDLVKLMGGWLELTIDGDFFKASVYLNKSGIYAEADRNDAV